MVICSGKKGPFTPQEDTLIKQHVAEWAATGVTADKKRTGVWTVLERLLNRRARTVCRRWENVLQHEQSDEQVGEAEPCAL